MSEAPSAGVPQLQMIQRMAKAEALLRIAADALAAAKKQLDDVKAQDADWMTDPGEYGWWHDTHQALKALRYWRKKIQEHALYEDPSRDIR